MKLFAGLFGRKAKPQDEATFDLSEPKTEKVQVGILDLEEMEELPAPAPEEDKAQADTPAEATASVNIWDLEDDEEDAPAAAPAPDRASARARRNRTRLVGFDKSDGDVVDLFQDAPAPAVPTQAPFPVGWLLVTQGPGRGHCFSLVAGMAQIGRGEDQAVRLDFGDMAISRNNHAAIVYDTDTRKFMLGHGGKANIVRLNDQPVISNEELSDGDTIKIGDTTLQLKALCGPDFDWTDTDGGKETNDVAIA